MDPSPQPPSLRPVRVADLVLTCAAVVLGLLTVALQSSADDATWRDVDALGGRARAADDAARRDVPARARSRRPRPRSRQR